MPPEPVPECLAREIIWNAVFGYTGCDDRTADQTTSAILNALEEADLEFAALSPGMRP